MYLGLLFAQYSRPLLKYAAAVRLAIRDLASTAEDIIMMLYVRFNDSAEGCTDKQTALRKVVANPFSADE